MQEENGSQVLAENVRPPESAAFGEVWKDGLRIRVRECIGVGPLLGSIRVFPPYLSTAPRRRPQAEPWYVKRSETGPLFSAAGGTKSVVV